MNVPLLGLDQKDNGPYYQGADAVDAADPRPGQLFQSAVQPQQQQKSNFQQIPVETGEIHFQNGAKYIGQHINRVPKGIGIYTYPPGGPRMSFNGYFENGLPHGQGTLKYVNGYEFVGFMHEGNLSNGKLTRNDLSYWQGTFRNNTLWEGKFVLFMHGQWTEENYKNGERETCCSMFADACKADAQNCVIL